MGRPTANIELLASVKVDRTRLFLTPYYKLTDIISFLFKQKIQNCFCSVVYLLM